MMRPTMQLLTALAVCGVGAAFTFWVGWPVYRTSRDSHLSDRNELPKHEIPSIDSRSARLAQPRDDA